MSKVTYIFPEYCCIDNLQIHTHQSAKFCDEFVETSQTICRHPTNGPRTPHKQSTDTSWRVHIINKTNLQDLKWRNALHHFLANAIITNCQDFLSVTAIGNLGIVSPLCA